MAVAKQVPVRWAFWVDAFAVYQLLLHILCIAVLRFWEADEKCIRVVDTFGTRSILFVASFYRFIFSSWFHPFGAFAPVLLYCVLSPGSFVHLLSNAFDVHVHFIFIHKFIYQFLVHVLRVRSYTCAVHRFISCASIRLCASISIICIAYSEADTRIALWLI